MVFIYQNSTSFLVTDKYRKPDGHLVNESENENEDHKGHILFKYYISETKQN